MNPSPEKNLTFNGIHGRSGKYLLQLAPEELEKIALGEKIFSKRKRHLTVLKERNRLKQEDHMLLEFGRNEDALADAGWAVVFPTLADMRPVHAVQDALSELLTWRRGQAGELYLECIGGENGVLPNDTADRFMRHYRASPGVVRPRKGGLPYYILLVGSPQEISFRFQYELDATYLVGRIYFDTLQQYADYAHSVVAAEKNPLGLKRKAVFFGTAHPGDPATTSSAEMLVANLSKDVAATVPTWEIAHLPPEQCNKDRLEALLGKGEAPALLFTATHGLGFDPGDALQEPFQGALLCQNFGDGQAGITRDHYLGAEDIASDFNLHGLVAFHFACFGAGTPQRDNFARPGSRAEKLAPRDFLARLPLQLLGHPRSGALAVVGHVDRAWTYSFKWGEAGEQTGTFANTLRKLMAGKPVGAALDDFNLRYAQIAVRLNNILNKAEVITPDFSELAGLWTANNDARSYLLLGDPAVRLPVAAAGAPSQERQALTPLASPGPEAGGNGAGSGGDGSGGGQAAPGQPAAPEAAPAGVGLAGAGEAQPFEPAPRQPAALSIQPAGPITIQIAPNGQVTLTIQPGLMTSASPGSPFTDPLTGPFTKGFTPFAPAGEDQAFDRQLWVRNEQSPAAEKGIVPDEVMEKLKTALKSLGEKVEAFANDVSSLEVRTYVSDSIEEVGVDGGKLTGDAHQRALTLIKLDGDTEVVVPTTAGEIDEALWEIHTRSVEQAQAYRAAMFKALGDFFSGLIPSG